MHACHDDGRKSKGWAKDVPLGSGVAKFRRRRNQIAEQQQPTEKIRKIELEPTLGTNRNWIQKENKRNKVSVLLPESS